MVCSVLHSHISSHFLSPKQLFKFFVYTLDWCPLAHQPLSPVLKARRRSGVSHHGGSVRGTVCCRVAKQSLPSCFGLRQPSDPGLQAPLRSLPGYQDEEDSGISRVKSHPT
ncbi:unnamed protein product [Boreogadus saida]